MGGCRWLRDTLRIVVVDAGLWPPKVRHCSGLSDPGLRSLDGLAPIGCVDAPKPRLREFERAERREANGDKPEDRMSERLRLQRLQGATEAPGLAWVRLPGGGTRNAPITRNTTPRAAYPMRPREPTQDGASGAR